MGCGEKVPPVEEQAHQEVCQAKEVACPAVDVGCTVTVPRKFLDDHVKTCQLVSQRPILLQLQALTREIDQLKGENKQLREENKKLTDTPAHQELIKMTRVFIYIQLKSLSCFLLFSSKLN